MTETTPLEFPAAGNLADLIAANAAENPHGTAVRTPPGPQRVELSWSRLAGEVAAARDRLTALGLAPGDRIVLIAPTTPEFLAEFFGAQAAGITVVAVNPLSTVRELTYYIEDSGAKHLIAHPVLAEPGERAAAESGIGFSSITPIGNEGPERGGAEHPLETVDRDGSDLAALLYTSGTTGRPKGAMLSVANLLAGAAISGRLSELTSSDTWATGLPLFHVFGLGAVVMGALRAGASLTLFPRWDPDAFAQVMTEEDVTIISGVPTMWVSLLGTDTAAKADRLRAVSSGGASLAVPLLHRFEERFGAPVAEGYGLTETSSFGTFNPMDGPKKPGSVGPAVPGVEIRIIDFTGEELPVGEVGEVCLRGPVVMQGYWNRPEATAEVIDADGWFRTGDLGRLDEDGYLYIVDRLKDLIIHGGYNVYPREVEEVLYEMDGVVEAAVIGTDDEKYGQQVTAVITPAEGTDLTAESVEAHCRAHLAAYKIPRIIEFVDALPKGPSGKILKREIVIGRERS